MNEHLGPETKAIIEAIKEGNAKIVDVLGDKKK
jgi:hypothetical protein